MPPPFASLLQIMCIFVSLNLTKNRFWSFSTAWTIPKEASDRLIHRRMCLRKKVGSLRETHIRWILRCGYPQCQEKNWTRGVMSPIRFGRLFKLTFKTSYVSHQASRPNSDGPPGPDSHPCGKGLASLIVGPQYEWGGQTLYNHPVTMGWPLATIPPAGCPPLGTNIATAGSPNQIHGTINL